MRKRLLWLIINNLTKTLNDLGNFFMSKTLIEHCQPVSASSLGLAAFNPTSIEINGQLVKVTATECNYGGIRIWFVCPNCQKRMGKLFRKPMSKSFFCRRCNDLTYLSTRLRRSLIEEDARLMKRLISH